MKARKLLAGLSTVVASGLLLSGCGETGASSSSGGASVSKPAATTGAASVHSPVTITVAAWNDAADSLKAEIPGFEKKYPWIHVNIEYVDGTYQKITPELVAGNAPDIIQTQQRDFPYFLNKFPGDFVKLNSYMGSIKNHIAPVALNPTMQNGSIYAAPWDLGLQCIIEKICLRRQVLTPTVSKHGRTIWLRVKNLRHISTEK
ncbi:hypothetical protein GCM10025858_31900 [Alicyclobacillus sacchari]|uniref:ABC transporter substrate-binding protein n=1 Tax=Alicyclobacillus sacchari TaxID=392010 RepID=UPI0023E90323|nr:extracellular solute-binding protein [Alicyclobacillus sacchari]GMA58687.1 hypothetical protein GCM10025858_31900 [Alicyclobacillus sacchari]